MVARGRTDALIGLDIGWVNTRVSAFGVQNGKFCLLGSARAHTDYGYDGHLAAGVQEALEKLQGSLKRQFMRPATRQTDQVALDQESVAQVD